MTPPPDIAPDQSVPALTPDLVYKRDVLRRRLGTECGDRAFRAWLERSLAAIAPAEAPVAEPAPPASRAWSDEERAFVRAGYAAGVSAARIAEALGRSRRSVVACARRQKQAEPARADAPEISVPEPPAADKRSRRAAPDHDWPIRRHWPVDEIGRFYRMFDEGATPQEIADALGRSYNSVVGFASEHALSFRGRPDHAGDGRDGGVAGRRFSHCAGAGETIHPCRRRFDSGAPHRTAGEQERA